jgi:hypothetical protein
MCEPQQQILARWVYDGYPHSDLLPLEPPPEGETLAAWYDRCEAEIEGCHDGMFSFLVRELIEGGEGLVEEAGRLLDTVVNDVENVRMSILEHADKCDSAKLPGKKR